MRVLHVINSMGPGGAERLVMESIPYYLEHDVEISLLLLNGTEHPFLLELKQKNPQLNIITLGKGSVYNPILILKLLRHIRSWDLIHVNLFPALYWVAIAKMISFRKILAVYTEHNQHNRRRRLLFFKPWDKWFYRQYRKIIAVSTEVGDVLRNHLGISQDRISVIPNGIPIESIDQITPYSKQELGLKEGRSMILQVSSFTPQKDQATLIRAVASMDIKVELTFVGVGPTLAENRELSLSLGIEEQVHFLKTRSDVTRLMKTADVIVLSTNYEGLSLTSIEAMASGTPFVASRVPGLERLMEGAGILFTAGDEKELADTLSGLLTDQELAQSTIRSGRLRAEQYHIKNTVDKHLALYRKLCPNPSS